MDLAVKLQKIYDSEINVEITISWLYGTPGFRSALAIT
jgi:hypothetical protein